MTFIHLFLLVIGLILCINSLIMASTEVCRHEGRWLPGKAGLILSICTAADTLQCLPVWIHVVIEVFILLCFIGVASLSIYILRGWLKKDNHVYTIPQAVVLGSSLHNGVVTRTLQLRLDKALAWLNGKNASVLYISGGLDEGEKMSEAFAMETYLLKCGAQPDKLLKEEHSHNTVENFRNIMALGASKKIVVITSGYHMARAFRCARLAGFEPVGLAARIYRFTFISEMARECGAIILYYKIEFIKKWNARKEQT